MVNKFTFTINYTERILILFAYITTDYKISKVFILISPIIILVNVDRDLIYILVTIIYMGINCLNFLIFEATVSVFLLPILTKYIVFYNIR